MDKPILTQTDEVLMYGDRVRFFWQDADYYYNTDLQINWEGELAGLYAGPSATNPKLAVVTVVSQGPYRGTVLYPRIEDLIRIEHPLFSHIKKDKEQPKEKESEKKYDRITLENMKGNILANFDFCKVHTVMSALDWGWASLDGHRVPMISEIMDEAKRLLDEVIESHLSDGENHQISTGGLEVAINICEEDGIPDLSLKFVVEDWYEGGDCWESYEKDYVRRHSDKKKKKRRRFPNKPSKFSQEERIKYAQH